MANVHIKNLTTGKYFQSNPGHWLKTDEELTLLKSWAHVNPSDLEQPTDPSVILWTEDPSEAPVYDTDNWDDQEAIETVLKTTRYLFPDDIIETV